MSHSRRILVCVFFALALPWTVSAQYDARSLGPDTWNERLEIGPVEGLTTIWHTAPKETAVPLGVTLELRVEGRQPIRWTGAQMVESNRHSSVARYHANVSGRHVVTVEYETHAGTPMVESITLDAVDTTLLPVRITSARLTAKPVTVDDEDLNASSIEHFFRDESIDPVRQVMEDHYVIPASRWFRLEADVDPAAFAPLVEWHLDGKPLKALGNVRMRLFPARQFTLEGGLADDRLRLSLDTYRVEITSHSRGDDIPSDSPVTFKARTQPAGYEEYVTWMASTKYGVCTPQFGQGPEFTVRFDDTTGAEGEWLGVKAGQATFSKDGKGSDGELVEASPKIAAILGVDRYQVSTPTPTTVDIKLFDGDESGESVSLAYFGEGQLEDKHSSWIATHSSGEESFQFQLDILHMFISPDETDTTFAATLRHDGAEFIVEAQTQTVRTSTTSEQSFSFVRYTFGESQFEVAAEAYDPAVDDPAFREWLLTTGAQDLLNHRQGLRLATVLVEPNLNAHLPTFSPPNRPLVMTPADFIGEIADAEEESDDHSGFSTTRDCAITVVCAASGWGGVLGCVGCFAAAASCGWGIGEELASTAAPF